MHLFKTISPSLIQAFQRTEELDLAAVRVIIVTGDTVGRELRLEREVVALKCCAFAT